ncbi:MAG: aldo/keto reductase [Thermoproteus sp.]
MMELGSLKASDVGLGAWQAGGRAWTVDRAELLKAYRRAFELGINFVDTAEIYGWGESERLVGEAIRGYDVIVATKVAGFHWGSVEKSARASLARLGRIDLLQLHWPPPVYAPLCRVVRDLERLKEAGLVSEIGVSNFDARLLRRAAECLKRHEIVSDQVEYNPFNRSADADEFRKALGELGVKIIAWSPLAKGAALGKWGPDRARRMNPSFKKASTEAGRRVVEAVRSVAQRRGASPAAVVLAWLKHRGALPIPGVKNAAQAEDAAGALRLQLPEEDLRLLDEATAPFIAGGVGMGGIRYVPGFLQELALRLSPL